MATRISPPQNKTYYINPAYLTFNENSGYGANLIQVSASSSCYISVYDPANGIGYSDADRNYRRWKVTAYNNKFPDGSDDKLFHIYIRLESKGTSALIVYDTQKRGVRGGLVVETTDENGNKIEKEEEVDEGNLTYYYIRIGNVSEVKGSLREITYDTGYLESDQGIADATEVGDMWELDKYSTPWLIKAKQWLASFTVKGFISLVGGLIFKKGDEEKVVSDIKRSTDSDDDVPINDETIPTTKYVQAASDNRFLRKDQDDRSVGKVASDKGFEVGEYKEGVLGSGAAILMKDGSSYGEVDFLKVRKKATFTSITVQELKHVGGEIVLSPAAMVCTRMEERLLGYVCYFEKEDSDGRNIYNEFVVGDQARCQTFNLSPNGADDLVGNHYYWRLVTEVGDDYIVLSKTDCDTNSDIPKTGDNISQLGNRNDPERQNAIILSAYGADAPSYKQYKGINSYSLEGKEVTKLSPYGNVITGNFILQSTGKRVDEELEKLQVDWDSVLEQTDKEFTMWFHPYDPTFDNLPAVEWTTEELRQLHNQDLFFNTSVGTSTSGKAYRFEPNGQGGWQWGNVTDAETIKALESAAKAQQTADKVTEKLDTIVSDGILSSLEKKEVLKEWEALVNTYNQNDDTARDFGLTFTDSDELYENYLAYVSLGTYLNGGATWDGVGTPLWLTETDVDQPIDADMYRSKWTSYYETETALVNRLSAIAKKEADNARAEAEEANASISEITADNVLSSVEKKGVLKEWESVVSAYAKNTSNADSYGVAYTDYTSAYNALGKYLNGGTDLTNGATPLWLLDNHLSENTVIDPTEYRSKWVAYYDAEIVLLDAVSKVIEKKADDAQQTADGKIRCFVDRPVPPYNKGDRWANASYGTSVDNEDMVCIKSKAAGESFSILDWEPASGVKTLYQQLSDTMDGSVKDLTDKYSSVCDSISGHDARITENEDSISAISGRFESDGTIKKQYVSGFVTGNGDFASLFSRCVDEDGVVTEANISTHIEDGIAQATIQADKINFIGKTVINDKFEVDENGNVTMNGLTAVDGSFSGVVKLDALYRHIAPVVTDENIDLTGYSGFKVAGNYLAPLLSDYMFTELRGLWIGPETRSVIACEISFNKSTVEVLILNGTLHHGVESIQFEHSGGFIKVEMLGTSYSDWGGQCWSIETTGEVDITVVSPNS